MKKRILKTALAVILTLTLVVSLAACSTGSSKLPDAESANGKLDGTDISWEYDKSDKTLEINGSGAMPNWSSSEDVPWYDQRHSVEKLDISDEITSIGDYAFYYFISLKDADIQEGVTSLGDYAFAFCTSLKSVELPDTLTSVGDSCFEACTALEDVFVPASVTELGARAFAHCRSLETALIMAQISELGELTFKGCSSLKELCLHESVAELTVADNAFEDCRLSLDDVDFTALLTGDATLTVNYVYEDGETAAEAYTQQLQYGASYSVLSPTVDGYTADVLTVTGVISDFNTVRTVVYKSDAAETEAEETAEVSDTAEDKKEDKITVGTVVAIVIFAVVIAAIIVLVIVMIRSDKKQNASKPNSKGTKKK